MRIRLTNRETTVAAPTIAIYPAPLSLPPPQNTMTAAHILPPLLQEEEEEVEEGATKERTEETRKGDRLEPSQRQGV